MFNHSWDGLGEPEQVLWSRLAVFRGGCTADAAQQITGAGFAALKNLVNKSLLRQENSPNPQAELRFVLLEPIRDYTVERLSERQEMPSLQRAHAAYYLALAETVSEQWDSPTVAIEQIDRDYDNLRAALQWACEGGDLAIGFRLCVALRKYWQRRGLYSEGLTWLADLLARDDPAVLDARIHGMNTAAWLATDQHDYTQATQLFEQSAALRDLAGGSDETYLPSATARQARAVGQYQRATALFEDALSRHRVLGDRGGMSTAGIGLSLYELGLVLREQGEYARAAVDWSPDGAHVAGVGSDSLVTIYSAENHTPPRILSGHNRVIYGVGWGPDGRWIASSEWDNQIRLWDTISGACLQVLQHPGDSSNFFDGVAWSPDGTRLAVSTYAWGLEVFDLTLSQRQWASRPFSTWIHRVVWSPNGALLAGGGDDGGVYIWDAEDNTLLQHMTGHQGMVWTVAWSPDGTLIASGGGSRNSGELFIWDALHGELVQKIVEHPGTVYAIAWDITGEVLISGSSDGRLRWWDLSNGQAVRIVDAHTDTVQALRHSHDGTMLTSCGDDGAIMIWNLRTGEHLNTLRRDRPYERLNITGIRGLTDAQKATLRALGAVDHA